MTVQEATVVITQHVNDVHHAIHQAYFPDLPFIDSALLCYIMNEILFAEHERRPLTVRGLARLLDMPHTTLLLRLNLLEQRGLLQRRMKRLRSEMAVILSPAGRAKVARLRKMMIDTGAKLARIEL